MANYLYGHRAKDGETPTHTIDGVGYIGVVAPDIYTVYTPELQEQCRYALVASHSIWANIPHLAIMESPAVFENGIAGDDCDYVFNKIQSSEVWERTSAFSTVLEGVVWSNYDLYDKDGSLVCSKTDPVPVGGEIDPNSLLQGYLVGCRLRALRGKV